jgi:lipoprotein-releasing system permease protein
MSDSGHKATMTEARTSPRGTRPFAPFEWMLSLRYLRARRKEGVISVIAGFSFLGIMLGVATLIIVMAVMNGFRSELLDKILGLNGHLVIQPMDSELTDFDEVNQRIVEVPGVTHSFPFVEGQVLASSPSGGFGAMVRGMRLEDLRRLGTVADNLLLGDLGVFGDGEAVVVGSRLAERLGLRVGDAINLISPRGAATPFGTTPRVKAYPIAAIFEIGMSEYDSAFIFMPLDEAQAYFNLGETVSGIEIFVDDPDAVGGYRSRVETAAERPIFLTDWRQRNVTFFSALEVERNVMFLILTLIVLVAALNIISGLIMLVKDKSHDIAIMRTMGATQGAVMRVFFITGAAIGVVGTFAGLVLGAIVSWNVETIRQFISRLTGTELFAPELYYLSRLPAEMHADDVVSVVLMALTLSFLATLYPSWRAARLDPVEALRYG